MLELQEKTSTIQNQYVKSSVIIVLCTILFRASSFSFSAFDWDEGVYITMAQRWIAGDLPYVAVWDQHPPGMAAVLAIVQIMVPDPVFGAHLVTAFAIMATALLIHRFCASFFDRPDAGLLAALLYILCTSRWVALAANPLIFNNALTALAATLLLSAMRDRPINQAKAIAAALALGIGLQFKYVMLPECVLFCLGFLVESYRRNRNILTTSWTAIALLLAGLLPTALAIIYFWWNGALHPFLSANLTSNIDYLHIKPTLPIFARGAASGLAPVLGCVLLVAITLTKFVRRRVNWNRIALPNRCLMLWIAAAILDVCLPLKFFVHYFFALYPPLCIAGAIACSLLAERNPARHMAGIVILFATAMPLWAVSAARVVEGNETDGPRTVARYIRNHTRRDSTLFVYDYNPVVYALARKPPPTPYVLGSELAEYNDSSHIDGAAEIERVMETSPDYVVLRQRRAGETTPTQLDALLFRNITNYHICYEEADVDDGIITIYAR